MSNIRATGKRVGWPSLSVVSAVSSPPRKRRRPQPMSIETLEARQLLATGPQLLSIKPDAATILQNFDVLETSPRELRFIFNPGQVIDPSSFDGIRVTRSGKDQSFEKASAVSDLGTLGAVVFRFDAAEDGIAGNSIAFNFRFTDLGSTGAPRITVVDRTIRVDLNSNPAHPSNAGELLTALNSNLQVNELLTASIVDGSPLTNLITGTLPPADVVLHGANQARAVSDLQTGGTVQIEFLANAVGPDGRGITVRIQHADRGPTGAPLVTVSGKEIQVTLNTNANARTTAGGLVAALQGNAQAASLITAVQRAGAVSADVATPSIGIGPIPLAGGTDIEIVPAYVGLDPDRSNEVIVRFGEKLNDDLYSVDVLGAGDYVLQNVEGDPFGDGTNARLLFQIDRGAQVVAVVPQPVVRNASGGLVQTKNVIDVYFNDDDLNPSSATNPQFYRLIQTGDTVTNTDDVVYLPTSIQYDPVADRARLTFGSDPQALPGGNGTYRLRIGTAEALPLPPVVSQPQALSVLPIPVNGGATTVPVTFVAADDFGRAVRVVVSASDLGGPGLPQVTVDASSVYLVANSNVTYESTVQDMITAVEQSPVAATRLRLVASSGNLTQKVGRGIAAMPASARTFSLTGVGSSFGTASNLGTLGPAGVLLREQIGKQFFPLDLPGSNNEPGHRDLEFESHLVLGDRAADQFRGISIVSYNFRDVYGRDPNGVPLHNVITEAQKQRAREIFELWGNYLGVQFYEVQENQIRNTVLGGVPTITIATGDLRAIAPQAPTGPNDGVILASGRVFDPTTNLTIPTVILDRAETWADQFGGDWFETAQRGIASVLGIADANDLPDITTLNLTQSADETIFPNDHDIVHGQHVFRPESKDIDLYRFDVTAAGHLSAEIISERLATTSGMNSLLTLYRQTPSGTRELIARNDDYFSKDSFLDLDLAPGVYFVGVSASGNDQYDPNLEDSGFGGTTEGKYELRMNYRPDALNGIVDRTGKQLDGDADGVAGGVYDFWFHARSASDTLFVDKAAPAGGTGTLQAPFRTITAALQAAGQGDIVRIVGNGGADGDLATVTDNLSYEIGFNSLGQPLPDGSSLRVPKGVTVMVDAGAIFKMRLSTIVVGSTSPTVDRSHSVMQVLGTPNHSVYFTSLNDESLGLDTSPFTTTPRRGDWGGIEFRNDSDRNEGRPDYEAQGAFLSYVNHAEIRYGGGSVLIDSEERVISPIQMIEARPTVSHNVIRFSADAAVAANPDSFEETTFFASDSLGVHYQSTLFTPDYRRVGPNLHDNRLTDNTINGMFIKVSGSVDGVLETMTVSGRWDDTDIVHVVSENLIVAGQPGGGIRTNSAATVAARRDARLAIDAGTVVKLEGTRIEVTFGGQLIAEGTVDAPVVFTALDDDRFGAGGTFQTITSPVGGPLAGSWAGIYAGPTTRLSIDYAWVSFAGGNSSIEGGFAGFNPIEIHQAKARVANSRFEFNAEGIGGTVPSDQSDRNGRGSNAEGTLFVRGAQPIIVNNLFSNSAVVADDGGGETAPAININVNALNHFYVRDWGRSTGLAELFTGRIDNQGPLIRGNRFDNETTETGMVQGMVVRAQELTTESVWDDTDITHILFGNIVVPDFHTFGGLRLQSSPNESLVVKLGQPSAGITLFSRSFSTTGATDDLVLADFNRDGRIDIATSTAGTSVEVLLNSGGGTFGASTAYTLGAAAASVDAADLDGDGDIDLIVGTATNVAFLANNGDGTFAMPVDVALPRGGVQSAKIVNLNGDANPDLVVIYQANPSVSVLMSNGGGTFAAAVDYGAGTIGNIGMDSADVDGDGDQDLVIANAGPQQSVSVLLNDGAGVLGTATQVNVGATPQSVAAGDFDGDGDVDLAVGGTSAVFFLGGNGDGTFAAPQSNGIVGAANDIAAGDLNGDGDLDIVASSTAGGTVSVLLGNGDGTFDASLTVPANGGAALDLADLDGDGDLDVGTATLSNRVTVLVNGRSTSANGGFVATGQPLENADRIGGRIQVVGQPGAPVILTSLADDTVGAGLTARGTAVTDTNTDGSATVPTPGDWGGFVLGPLSHDRNVEVFREIELSSAMAPGSNGIPLTAQALGELAPSVKSGDENRRLGFEIHGYLSAGDRDVYSFRGVAGSEVWFDIDRTDSWLDTVVELIDSDGTVLASSSSSLDEALGTSTPGGIGRLLRKSSYTPADLWTSNPKDAGMRLVLPGVAGRVNLYHVRVRMNNEGAPASGTDPRMGGSYQLNVRLQDLDEISGSTIRFADIRYANRGIDIVGQPSHSPLLGEIAETIADNNVRASAQNIGNVLQSNRGAVSLAGSLSSKRDVDWFQFNVDYSAIAPYPHDVASLVFDVDYADQLGRPNASIYLFDANGNLIFFNQDSNVADDLIAPATNAGTADLSRGSLGRNDSFLGPISLRNGTYFMAVTSSANIPDLLYDPAIRDNPNLSNDPGTRGTGGLTVRIEPITTVERIAEDRIPTESTTGNQPVVDVLIDPDSSVRPWHLGDMTLYVSGPSGGGQTQISIVDPFTGADLTVPEGLDPPFGPTPAEVRDIAMRHNGTLFGFTADGTSDDDDSGDYVNIDWQDATLTNIVGNDGIATYQGNINDDTMMCETDPMMMMVEQADVGFHAEGLTYAVFNNAHQGFVVGGRGPAQPPQVDPPCGVTYTQNILYLFDPDTGVATSAPEADRDTGDPEAFFMGDNAGTQIVERGQINTAAQGNALITGIAVLPSGIMYAVSDRGGLYRIADPMTANQGRGLATFVGNVQGMPAFSGLVAGPMLVEDGMYENMLFGIDANGVIHAFNDRGVRQNVFYNGTSQLDTGVAGANGLAFSNLVANLWHPTNQRGGDAGHGIDPSPDFTRTSAPGGDSYYFGYQSRQTNGFPGSAILDPGNSNDYAFPGGAHGSLVTKPFDLVGYEAADLPVLMFNYFLETEEAQTVPGSENMYDSFRVLIADQSGSWELLATNNGFQSETSDDEYDLNPNTVEALDNQGGWRTARVDLSRFAGRQDLRLRFDFATAGTLQIGNIAGDMPTLRTGGDELIAPEGSKIVDGDTFVIFRDGNLATPVTFEFNSGYTLVLPEGGRIDDGDIVSMRIGSNTVGFEFDFDGITNPQSIAVPISRLSSAEDVATALTAAILNSGFPGTPHRVGHRINMEAPATIEIKTDNAPTVQLTGSPAVAAGNRAITVHTGMDANAVAEAIRPTLAAAFANNRLDVIKYHNDTVFVFGHAVDNTRLGPMGVSRDGADNGLPGDSFGNINNIRHSRDNDFEGVYIDDILIGFAARGEMVSGANGGDTFVDAPGSNDPIFTDITTGTYQVEIRPTTEFTLASSSAVTASSPPDALFRILNIRDRLSESFSLDIPSGNQIVDGTTFSLGGLTFELDNDDYNNGIQPGRIEIPYRTNRSAAEIAQTVVTVINQQQAAGKLAITATARQGATRVDLHGDLGVLAINASLFDESNDSLATAVDSRIPFGTSGSFRGRGSIGDNYALVPLYQPDDAFFTAHRRDVDLLRFELLAGQVLSVDVDANEILSGLNSLLRLFDENGNELASADNVPAPDEQFHQSLADPYLSFVAPEDGVYYVGVSAFRNFAYDPLVEGSGTQGGSSGDYEITARIGGYFPDAVAFEGVGDANRLRDQGQLLIHSNYIRDSATYGIQVAAGDRDTTTGAPQWGPPRALAELNVQRLTRGPAIFNNVIVGQGDGAIRFAGDPGGDPAGAVPFGRIVNNTLVGNGGDFGGGANDAGVLVENNASPTILNNIIANFAIPVSIDGSSSSTVLGGNMYRANGQDPYQNPALLGAFDIDLDSPSQTNKRLFIDAAGRNFYLMPGSRAIDASVDALQDRPAMVQVENPLGILPSPILAPDRDLTGQLRVDDPDVEPISGIGQMAFKDRGALDRSDFTGPQAELVTPVDNDATDLDPNPNAVRLQGGPLFEIAISLLDVAALGGGLQGSGIDDSTVNADTVSIVRDGTLLVLGTDYRFDYDTTSNRIILTPLAGVWIPGGYVVTLDNQQITDIAGNTLQPNQTDATTRFTIALGQGVDFGDAPDPPYPTLLANNGARHTIEPGFFLGTGISGETNGRPSDTATGDLGDDGVMLTGLARQGTVVTVNVISSGTGFIDGWIDFNQDGDWDDSGEKIFVSEPVVAGTNAFDVDVPVQAVLGETFARFRLSRAGNLTVTGPAPTGEVEDYRLIISDPGIDFGDAPDPSYPTLVSSDGAAHTIVPGFVLGTLISAEDNGQPSPGADADNDDGVVLPSLLTGNETAVITVTASAAGFLDAWIDFNRDGDWDDAGEQILTSRAVVAGSNSLSVDVPVDTVAGSSFARFRLSSAGGLTPRGLAPDGEVEDYAVTLAPAINPSTFDFGDAPAPYPTLLADDGARHIVTTGFYLGNGVDPELDGQPSPNADADTGDDGVVFSNLLAGRTSIITVTASQNGLLDAWIDFNADGDWNDAGEQIFTSHSLFAGANSLTVDVPADAVNGPSFARFRFSSAGGLIPTGQALDGEVEDYLVSLIQPLQSWHNFDNPVDVNNRDGITPLDALLVINELDIPMFSDPVTGQLNPNPTPPPFFDVNNDGFVSPLDALLVINALPSSSSRAPMSGTVVISDGLSDALPVESVSPIRDIALRSILADDDEATDYLSLRRRGDSQQETDQLFAGQDFRYQI